MKTLICLWMFLLSPVFWSQDTVNIAFFNAEKVNDKVQLSWAISKGNLCYGTKILHSKDRVNFNEIGRIDGICGDYNEYRLFEFTDRNPTKDQLNYYRLVINNVVYSEIVSLHFHDLSEINYLVFPQPINNIGKLIFDNPNHQLIEFQLYSESGRIVKDYLINQDMIHFNAAEYEPGSYYFFLIKPDNETIKGRIIIIK